MLPWFAMMPLSTWEIPRGVDPEVVEMVEAIVDLEGGRALAEPLVTDRLDEAGLDSASVRWRGRWLPLLVVRISWAPGPGARSGRWEIILFASWPLGG